MIDFYLLTNLGMTISPSLVLFPRQGQDRSTINRMRLEHAVCYGGLKFSFPRQSLALYAARGRRYYSTRRVRTSNTLVKIEELVNRELPDTNDLGKLNPFYISGLADGESSFVVSIRKNPELKAGWMVALSFEMQLHKRDKGLLE